VLTKLFKAAAAAAAPRSDRPARAEVEPVALDLIERYGGDIMATARRYAANREDAEDAYQRGLEILLTKAPSTEAEVLVPWLKTVVKHEAYSLHRQRERAGQATAPELVAAAASSSDGGRASIPPPEQAERLERLQVGAEALGRLKPQEIRCMLLLAEGHSYKQICEITGYSYTKVNRCLTEGRRSFLRRVERIESGAECERLAPLLSALADGEATARDMAVLRPHLRSCLSCRAALRDAREVPARVAALAPLGLLAGALHPGASGGWLGSTVRSAGAWLGERLTALTLRGHELFEAASSHKLAAAAASAAALGGGGIATVEVSGSHGGGHHGGAHHAPVHTVVSHRAPAAIAPRWRPAAVVVVPTRPAHPPALHRRRRSPEHRRALPRQAPPAATPAPSPALIEPAGPAAPSQRASGKARPRTPQTGEFGP
jgi:RNA polymerase sigma factor (sigma-70 family)